MVTRVGGARRKTRGKMRKPEGTHGKISLRRYFQEFTSGNKVALIIDPAVQEGVFFRRFHGKVGMVDRKTGTCYVVKIRDGSKTKEIIAHPVHLRAIKE